MNLSDRFLFFFVIVIGGVFGIFDLSGLQTVVRPNSPNKLPLNLTFVPNPRPGLCFKRYDRKIACYPDFFFIGASKCGTTSLSYYLQSHPMIMNVNQYEDTKEGHRFDPSEPESMGPSHTVNYLKNFDYSKLRDRILKVQPGFPVKDTNDIQARHSPSDRGYVPHSLTMKNRPLVMEYTPNYLLSDEAPMLVHRTFPTIAHKLKFIVMLRDPVSRTASSWKFKSYTSNYKMDTFEEAVRSGIKQAKCIEECYNSYFNSSNEVEILPSFLHKFNTTFKRYSFDSLSRSYMDAHCHIKFCRNDYDTNPHGFNGAISTYAHVVKGLYVYQIINWLKVFELNQFLFITLEEYIGDQMGTLKKIFDFLGLRMFRSTPAKVNRTRAEYATMALDLTRKEDPRHHRIKDAQLQEGADGWDNEVQLQEIVRVVLNIARDNPENIDSQVTKELKEKLKPAFDLPNRRLKKLLGWKDEYWT